MRKSVYVYSIVGLFILSLLIFFSKSCKSSSVINNNMTNEYYYKISPDFCEDSAYYYIEKQLSFGPRIPATKQHSECGDWLSNKLSEFGATVIEQTANVVHYDDQKINIRNIIGSFQPEKKDRVILMAHCDTRPFADRERDKEKQIKPIMGADDGASGVAVLLEIARQLQIQQTEIGIDIIFFDLEDWGQPDFTTRYIPGNWWCTGSKYWSENPHLENYNAIYGILLDMVGANNATFMSEGYSTKYAKDILAKVWTVGNSLGYQQYFISSFGGYITDDHVLVNENMKIPSIDIINLKDSDTGFAPHWHTHNDNINIIDKETLKAVGQTVLEVLYREK